MKKNYFRTKSGAGAAVSASMDYRINLDMVLEGSLNPVRLRLVEDGTVEVSPGKLTLSSYYEGTITLDPEKVLTFKTYKVPQEVIKRIENELTEKLNNPESDLNYIIKELAEKIIMETYGYRQREELGEAVLREKIREQAEEIKKSRKTKIRVEITAESLGTVEETFGGYHHRPSFKVGESLFSDGFEEDDFSVYVSISYGPESVKDVEISLVSRLPLDGFTAYAGPGFVEVWDTVFLREFPEPTDEDIADAIESLDYSDEYDVTKKEDLERFKEEHEEELSEWWSEMQMSIIEDIIRQYS